MATFKGITLPDGETYLPEGGGGSSEKEWELVKTITLEEQIAYITETLDGQYKELILIFENLYSSNETSKGVTIAFNGNSTGTGSTSLTMGKFIQTQNYPSQGFFKIKFLPDNRAEIIGAGSNSASNRAEFNNVGCMTKEQMNNQNYIDKVSVSIETYSNNKMNAGAKFYIYVR